jgi:hypothetical protein
VAARAFRPGRIMLRMLMTVAALIAAIQVCRGLRECQAARRSNQ